MYSPSSSSRSWSSPASPGHSPKFSDVTLKLVGASSTSPPTKRVRFEKGSEDGGQCEMRTVRAHSIILKLRSGYFETRFNFEAAATATTSNGENGEMAKVPEILELHLVDGITTTSFITMLEFLYTDRAPKLDAYSLIDMLVAADFYQVASLRQYCLRNMKCHILRTRNMFDLLVKFHSTYPQMVDAKAVCLDYIDTHFCASSYFQYIDSSCRMPEPYENPKFLALPRELLCEIIRRDSLIVCERMIFDAVFKWGEEQCKKQGIGTTGANMRPVLGNALYLVRFPLIDSKWCRRYVVRRKILNAEEILDIVRCRQFRRKMPNQSSALFSSTRRSKRT